jgi:NAD(P)-dependent dehydrogenase (short-subunit alcohol dehydrogenase family)
MSRAGDRWQGLEPQSGRTFVVTGVNSGIGFEVGRALTLAGAHVVLAVRDTARGEHAAARLPGPGPTSVMQLDLADLADVERGAAELLDRYGDITGLICNAGVMGGPLLRSAQGFELQMATNHLGHAALVAAVWPLLHASASRVVIGDNVVALPGRSTAWSSSVACRVGGV